MTLLPNTMYDIKDFSGRAEIGLIGFDPKAKKFTNVNLPFCKLIGYTEEILLSKIYTDFMFHEDITATEEYLKNRTLKFSKLANFINRYVHGVTGKIITIMWVSDSLVYNENGDVNTAIAIDITALIDEYYRNILKREALLELHRIIQNK